MKPPDGGQEGQARIFLVMLNRNQNLRMKLKKWMKEPCKEHGSICMDNSIFGMSLIEK